VQRRFFPVPFKGKQTCSLPFKGRAGEGMVFARR